MKPAVSLSLVLAVAIAAVSAAPLAPNHYWFNQPVDHFDPFNTKTYQQLYWVNDTFYKPGGPVFFFLGGEAPIHFFDFQEVSALDWAKQYNALYVALEHRYYGESNPVPDFAPHNMKYLSSQQALADAANFVEHMKAHDTRFSGKWLVLGCSYSGALSSWFRTKYPHLVIGSIAPSGPINAVWDFSTFLGLFGQVAPTACVAATKAATSQMETLLLTKAGRDSIARSFNACYPIESKEDIFNFKYTVANFLGTTPQWENPPQWNMTSACKTLTTNTNYVDNWAKSFIEQTGAVGCTSFRFADFLAPLRSHALGNLGRSWLWQTCVEFGYFATTYPGTSPFFSDMGVDVVNSWCAKAFDIPHMKPNTEWTNAYYGGLNVGGSNILFTNGHYDPWHLLGLNADPEYAEKQNVHAVTYMAAHCAPMDAPDPTDPPSLIEARKKIVAWIGDLLAKN